MKRILITGANSYVGTSVENWLKKSDEIYFVDVLDLKDNLWNSMDFTSYNTVFHVAGIVHSEKGHETKAQTKFYFDINCELTLKVAMKAKESGVKQFIFMSTASVYGKGGGIYKDRIITENTVPIPINSYGKSKLLAEQKLQVLENECFKIAILRPPMIYGKKCKGNFILLKKIALLSPLFPDIENQRSMLFIDNLCEFVRLLIEHGGGGIYFPQNTEYVQTSEMVRLIACNNKRKIWVTPFFNWFIWIASIIPCPLKNIVEKAFGNFTYENTMSISDVGNYQLKNLRDSLLEI